LALGDAGSDAAGGAGDPRVSRARAAVELAVVALSLASLYLFNTQTRLTESGRPRSPAGDIVWQVAVNAATSLMVVAAVLRAARQRWADIGLGRTGIGSAIKWGLIGLVAIYALQALLVGALVVADMVVPSASGLGTAHPPLALWFGFDVSDHMEDKRQLAEQFAVLPGTWVLPIALLVGFYEELLFRGLVLSRVRVLLGVEPGANAAARAKGMRLAAAVALTAAFFAVGHLYQGPLGVAQTFLAGVALAALVIARGTLWPAIFAHASVDLIGLVAARLLLPWFREQVPAP
jgi:membrane protease YdiL (CAAX protease family)